MVRNLPANEGDLRDGSSIPGSGRSPGEGNGNPLQYSCLENPMDGGARKAQSMRLQRDGYDQTTTRTFSVTRVVKIHESITDSRENTKTK